MATLSSDEMSGFIGSGGSVPLRPSISSGADFVLNYWKNYKTSQSILNSDPNSVGPTQLLLPLNYSQWPFFHPIE